MYTVSWGRLLMWGVKWESQFCSPIHSLTAREASAWQWPHRWILQVCSGFKEEPQNTNFIHFGVFGHMEKAGKVVLRPKEEVECLFQCIVLYFFQCSLNVGIHFWMIKHTDKRNRELVTLGVYPVSCINTRSWIKPSHSQWAWWCSYHTHWYGLGGGAEEAEGVLPGLLLTSTTMFMYLNRYINMVTTCQDNYDQVISTKKMKRKKNRKKGCHAWCAECSWTQQNGQLMIIKYSCEHYVFITDVGDHKIK